jgi:hypothetical protein
VPSNKHPSPRAASITLHNNSNEEQIEGKENEDIDKKRMKPF